jgi:hypothetical protein
MTNRGRVVLAAVFALAAAPVGADEHLSASLVGFQEVPVISTTGAAHFTATISRDETEIAWEMSYDGLEGTVTQSHIHFGQAGVAGGISVFLCTNLGNSAGTQACPPPPATISGTIHASDVIGPTVQGIGPGEFAELIKAIRNRLTYVNIHSTKWPGGEIRGILRDSKHGEHDHGEHGH